MKPTSGQSATAKTRLLVLFYLSGVTVCSALQPDQQLVALVPPDSQLIAGMHQIKPDRQASSLLLLTSGNSADLEDFFALTGSDASSVIHQVILTASAGHNGNLPEHSLVATGHFDQKRIFASAKAGSSKRDYRGVLLLVISPFDRERNKLTEDRILVIVHSHLALFGTVASVTKEIDRYLDGVPPDSTILQRLGRLRDRDDSWCLIAAPALGPRGSQAFETLDPTLGDMIRRSSAFQYGMRFGRQVELDYDFNVPAIPNPDRISDPQIQAPVGEFINASSFSAPLSTATEDGANLRGVLRISRSRYDRWLADVSTRNTGASH